VSEISKTVDQALTVLLEVGERGPLTPARLARDLRLNRTVVHRLLSTLHQRGFVVRHEHGYVPGPLLIRIAERVQPEMRAQGRAVMQRLAGITGETVVMHVPDGDDAVVIEQVVAERNVVRVAHEIGSRHKLVDGASGRSILAFRADEAIERTVRGLDGADALRRQLDGVRRLGYAISHDELQQGVHGLAVPVLDDERRAAASLAVLVPVSRAANLLQHLEALLEATERLSQALSFAA
jgi:IclR family transcriptional regulator, KDG regulon repressor